MQLLPLALLAAAASAATREEFVVEAGGAWAFTGAYNSYRSLKLKDGFWAYWDNTKGRVLTAYVTNADLAPLPEEARPCAYMNGIHECGVHSVEHIVPKSFTRAALADEGIMFGAENNVLNWVPALHKVNAYRSNNRYDTENDDIVDEVVVVESGGAVNTTVEFDDEREFVVPTSDRGEMARAVLYMVAVYDLDALGVFSQAEVQAFRSWSLSDKPGKWEQSYNAWALATHNISNPLLTTPGVWEKDDDVWEIDE
ncbi:Endonuclease I [Diplonema papillatum]|nr:Endonuclease I [Diplonema papillatum]